MKLYRLLSFAIIFFFSLLKTTAQPVSAAASGGVPDALVIPGDFADPSVILVNGTYYAVGTSSEWAPHFPIFSSKDLRSWKQVGYVFDKKPEWTAGSFWAPELFYRNGKFYVYYTARRATDNISCIGVATATRIEDGFTDHGIIVQHGREAIDAFIVEDADALYMTYKAYGLDKRPIELLGVKMSDDGLRLEGEPFSFLQDTARQGLEGQCIVKQNGYFYLLYSIGACCGAKCTYAVNVARSRSLRGPYINHTQNPILTDDRNWKCPGHGTLVATPDSSWYYLHHAYDKRDDIFSGRQGLLRKMLWSNEWPSFVTEPVPGLSSPVEIIDDFKRNDLSDIWQWDFRHAMPLVELNKKQLCLSGEEVKSGNPTGIVLTTRPYSADFEMSVTVTDSRSSLQGLVFYGDAHDAIGIGVRNYKVMLWQVKDSTRTILWQDDLSKHRFTTELKMVMNREKGLTCYFRKGKTEWKAAGGAGYVIDPNFLPQWDRSPRPGLHNSGSADQQACFSDFRIVYN